VSNALRSVFLRELAATIDPAAAAPIVDVVRAAMGGNWASLGPRLRLKWCLKVAERYHLAGVPWFVETLATSADSWPRLWDGHPWRHRFIFVVQSDMPSSGAVGTKAEVDEAGFQAWREKNQHMAWVEENPIPAALSKPPRRVPDAKSFQALVLYHCLGLPLAEVAGRCGFASRGDASKAIHRAGRAVGIQPRRGGRGGRPKRPKANSFARRNPTR